MKHADIAAKIIEPLRRGEMVRAKFDDIARVHIDTSQPFLCVYREPAEGDQDIGTQRLLLGESSYLIGSRSKECHQFLSDVCLSVAKMMSEQFGGFLLFELWSRPGVVASQNDLFRILAPSHNTPAQMLEDLESALLEIQVEAHASTVSLEYTDRVAPRGLRPLLSDEQCERNHITCVALEVQPIYRAHGQLFPFELRALHRGLGRALKRGFFSFAHAHTSHKPAHYHELGRRSLTSKVWEVDKQLADIQKQFDLLLHVTPTNVPSAWQQFQSDGFDKTPEFLYRQRPLDPSLVKRQLFSIPIEEIDDPTVAHMFIDKREELDRKLSLIADRNTPSFFLGSQQLYGVVDNELRNEALGLLSKNYGSAQPSGRTVDAAHFAYLARRNISEYRKQASNFNCQVTIREDISGIMVSSGDLLIGSDFLVSEQRVNALLAHEIGTHAISYFNGIQQPLQELAVGMTGYESMQEGLAVLAEYLVGGLNPARIRLLGARVAAVDHLLKGADFVENFRVLGSAYGFTPQTAFNICMRVYRGGGFCKDVVYLRGLRELLQEIRAGRDIEKLYIGKLATPSLAMIDELCWRSVLQPAAILPLYLQQREARQRLDKVRQGVNLLTMATEA